MISPSLRGLVCNRVWGIVVQALIDSLALELPAEPESVAEARHAAAELARRVGADEADVKITVSEAVGNAVIHAYRDREPGEIKLEGVVERGKLLFIVSDRGVGMSPNLDSPGLHLGIPLGQSARFMALATGCAMIKLQPF